MSAPRIACSGSAGTGKSTLGRALAGELGVPFIEEGMRRRIEGGFKLYQLDQRARRDLLRELWEEQREQEEHAAQGYVSDRSSLDFAAFWLHYGLQDAEDETAAYIDEMVEHGRRYDVIALCPWGALPLKADGVRSTNRWLQLRYHALLEGLHLRWTQGAQLVRIPEVHDPHARLQALRDALADSR